MSDSAPSSIAKVTSPPSPSPRWSRPAWLPSSGSTCSRSASASSRASSRGGVELIGSGAGSRAEGDLDVLMLAVADHLQRHLVARLEQRDQAGEVTLAHQRLAVDGDDHVAARVDVEPLEADLLVRRLDPGIIGGTAGGHLRHQRAGVGVDPELVGELWVQRLRGDADECVLGLAVLAQLL